MKKIRRFIEISRDEGMVSAIRSSQSYLTARLLQLGHIAPYLPKQWKLAELEIDPYSVTMASYPANHGFDNEKKNLENFVEELEVDDTVYDIGANIGLYTCFAARKCESGMVIAFEPYPPNMKQIKNNVKYSSLKNVSTMSVALSDKDGTVEMSVPEKSVPGHKTGTIGERSTENESKIQIKTKRGDSLVCKNKVPQPNVVKIDVEGAEPLVCQGLESTLADEQCRVVFCEIHPKGHHPSTTSIEDFGMTPNELIQYLKDLGFSVDYKSQRGKQIHIKMIK